MDFLYLFSRLQHPFLMMSIRAGCHMPINATLLHMNVQWQATHTRSFLKISIAVKDKNVIHPSIHPSLLHNVEMLSPVPTSCVSQELPSAWTVSYQMPVSGRRTFFVVQAWSACSRGTASCQGQSVPSCSAPFIVFSMAPRPLTTTPPKLECEHGRRRGCPVTQREITACLL